MPSKLNSIQYLRALAVVLVVILHIHPYELRYLGHSLFGPFHLIGSSGVDLFFVISGFIMVFILKTREQSPLPFLWKRIIRIYPLYWIYSLLTLSVFLLPSSFVNGTHWQEVDLLKSFLLLPQHKLPLLHVGWTLVHEMYFYLAFALIVLVGMRYCGRLLAFWGVTILLGQALGWPLISGSALLELIFHPLTFEFLLGGFVALGVFSCQKHCRKLPYRTFLTLGFLCFFGFGTYYHLFEQSAVAQGWTRVLIYGLPSVLILRGAADWTKWEGNEQDLSSTRKVLLAIGDASYSIYLSHFLVLSASVRVIGPLFARFSETGIPLVLSLCFHLTLILLTCSFGLLSYRYVEVPLLIRLRNLSFSRPKSTHSGPSKLNLS